MHLEAVSTATDPSDVAATATRPPAKPSLSRTETWIVALALAAVPTSAGSARGLLVPGLRLSEAITVALGIWCVVRLGSRVRTSGPVFGAVFAFTAGSVVAGLLAASSRSDLPMSLLVQDSVGVAQYLILFVVAFNLAGFSGVVERFVEILIWAGGAMGVIAVLQLAGFQPSRDLGTFVTGNLHIADPLLWKAPRSFGLFYAWHALGGYLALVFILGIAVMAGSLGTVRGRRLLWLPIGAVLAGLLTTLTFAPIAIGLGGAAVVTVWRHKLSHLLIASFVFLIVFFETEVGQELNSRVIAQSANSGGELPQTIAYRLNVWQRDFLPLIGENFWTGYGPTSEADAVFAYPESMYIAVLLRGGVLLLLALAVLMVVAIVVSYHGSKAASPEWSAAGSVATATMATIPLLLCAMIIHPYLTDAGISQLFFVFVGISAAAAAAQKRRHR
ncbi:hypothetical protein RHDE110596_19980 [Prescottella defluvii]